MGRHAGHIALHSGIAGGADVILVPERPVDLQDVVRHIRARQKRGRHFSIVVAAEGAKMERSKQATVSDELDEVRPRPAGRDRQLPRQGDRAGDRLRGPGHGARPRPARRDTHRRATGCSPPATASSPATS
jgi:6-phosphofructokinase